MKWKRIRFVLLDREKWQVLIYPSHLELELLPDDRHCHCHRRWWWGQISPQLSFRDTELTGEPGSWHSCEEAGQRFSYQSLPPRTFRSQQIRNIFRLSVPSKIHREGCLRLCSFPAVWFYIISAAIHWHHCWLSWSDLAVPGQVWCQVISAPRLSGAQVPSQGCVRMDLRTPAAIINLSDMEITSESTVVSSFPSYL